jgi:hypothetical protein
MRFGGAALDDPPPARPTSRGRAASAETRDVAQNTSGHAKADGRAIARSRSAISTLRRAAPLIAAIRRTAIANALNNS